jgi:hypothetical protein
MTKALCVTDDQEEFASVCVAERIAKAIITRLEQHGQCSIMDIRALGFSLNDIARYWPEACRIAERKRPRAM